MQPDGSLYMPKVFAGKKSNGVVGEYQCLIRNNDGALLSNPARLRVACKYNCNLKPSNFYLHTMAVGKIHCKKIVEPTEDCLSLTRRGVRYG